MALAHSPQVFLTQHTTPRAKPKSPSHLPNLAPAEATATATETAYHDTVIMLAGEINRLISLTCGSFPMFDAAKQLSWRSHRLAHSKRLIQVSTMALGGMSIVRVPGLQRPSRDRSVERVRK